MDQSSSPSLSRFISASVVLSFSFLRSLSSFYPPTFPSLSPSHFGPPPRELNGTEEGCHFKMSPRWNKDPLTLVFLHFTTSPRFSYIHVRFCFFHLRPLKSAYLQSQPAFWGVTVVVAHIRCTYCNQEKDHYMTVIQWSVHDLSFHSSTWNSASIREKSSIINESHKADECLHFFPVLKRLW